MSVIRPTDRESFAQIRPQLQSGDLVVADSFVTVAGSAAELIALAVELEEKGVAFQSMEEQVDTTEPQGGRFFTICKALARLDESGRRERRRSGIEQAKEDGRYKGRKPIQVDEAMFAAVAARWKEGAITARQAMRELDLKPNTFYRRIKQWEEQNMKDYKQVEKNIRDEIKEVSKQGRKEIHELKKQVREEARDVKKNAEEKLDMLDVKREIRHGRMQAEAAYNEDVRQLRKDVETEAAELKKLLEDQE